MHFQCSFCRCILKADNSDCGLDIQCEKCREIITVPSTPVSTGAIIGNDFLILEEIGRGGMGIVYLTHQISLDRPAALKILAKRYAENQRFVIDFIKEARAAAKLNHPHIVQAYAVGEDEGIFFFAMEHIDGETMKSVLKREGRVSIDASLTIIQQVAEALDYAWKEQRLIHRDIKPDNIMITKNGRAKLSDLGLARIAGEVDDLNEDEVMGTPQYISPEHLTGAPMDGRSDIYSLGAAFYHMISGQFPFNGRDAAEIARKHVEEPLQSPKLINFEIPDSVCRIVVKMMEKNPNDRYQTAEELVEDIRLIRRGKAIALSSAKTTGFFLPKTIGKTLIINTGKSTGTFVPAEASIPSLSSSSIGISGTSGKIKTGRLSTTSLRKTREKKAMYQVITLVTICALAALCAVGFAIWKTKKDAREKEQEELNRRMANSRKNATHPPPVVVPPPPPPEPESTEYTEAADEIIQFASQNPSSASDIIVKCDEFFSRFPSPSYKCEEDSLASLLKFYIPLDEKRISATRNDARNAYLAVVREREEAEKQKQNEIDEKRREEKRKSELAELKRKKEEQQKKQTGEYKNNLEAQKDSLRCRFMTLTDKGDYDSAVKVFDGAVKEGIAAPDFLKGEAKKFSAWAVKMQDSISRAKKFWEAFSGSGDKLAGVQAEIRQGTFGRITEIKDGEVSVKTDSGNVVKAVLKNMPVKQFKNLAKKMAAITGDNEALFHYFLSEGDFLSAAEFVPNDEWKKEISEAAYSYLKGKIHFLLSDENETNKRELEILRLKYGKMDEFNRAMQTAKENKGNL